MGAAGAAVGAQGAGSAWNIFESTEQASILKDNAKVYKSQIPYVRAKAAEQARQLQVGKYMTVGAQKAGYAGRGLAVGGSLLDVMSDTVTNFDRDTHFALLEGELAARGLQHQADMSKYQSKVVVRDAVVGGVLNTTAVGARAQMPGFGGYTANPYQPLSTGQRPA